jgi:hypothetical protein
VVVAEHWTQLGKELVEKRGKGKKKGKKIAGLLT